MRTSSGVLVNTPFSEKITIAPWALNQFIATFYELFPNSHLANPEKVLRLLLKNIIHAHEKYYFCPSEIIFRIDNGALKGVYKRYRLTIHAHQRLAERFHMISYDSLGKDLEVRVALEIIKGNPLSQRERRLLNIGRAADAYRFQNRVYIIKNGSIVTVIEAPRKTDN